MKKLQVDVPKKILTVCILFACNLSFSQTAKDTIKSEHSSDAMIVNPGKVDDRMAVKPANPHDGMSILSDTAFLNKSIMDNRMEIRLSKSGQTKGTSPAVKKVAAMMIVDHTAMLNDLLKLARKKGGITDHHAMEMTMPTLPEGNEFDAAWAGEMLKMHEAKIVEMESFIGLTKNAELKSIVMKAIPKIKKHRELLLKIPGAKEKSKITHTV